ncbi:MAG: SusD/RagB family nutrient-binding outer membrane lipoprotein [Rhizobacter sp.]|nr:SusD/RagB family nutrient-binding outer membrane lipoprotein [Ferruginibacter sp.]
MKKILIFSTFAALLSTGCKKYLDVNEDPRTPQLVTAESLLPPMLERITNGIGLDARFTSKYVQNFANPATFDVFEGHGPASPLQGTELWSTMYLRLGKAVDQMIADAEANEKWNYGGIAKALRAWGWQTCTDHFGEMILKEAWIDDKYIFNYDTQEEIYAEVEKNCMEALEYFRKPTTKPILPSSDIMFAGNKDRWIRFTYGILARNAHHISNKASYDPAKVIEYCDSSLRSNADNAAIDHLGTITANSNAMGALRANYNSYIQSSTILKMLNGYHRSVSVVDPRINSMLVKSADGNFYGADPTFGDLNALPATNVKRIPNIQGATVGTNANRYLFQSTTRMPIMTYFEIQFMKAEAAFKASNPTLAYNAYREGVDKAIDFVNVYGAVPVTAPEKTAYLASASVAQTSGDLRLSDIMSQKYIALWGWNFEETWVDLRRYDYDTLVFRGYTIPVLERLNINNGGKLVQRFKPQNTEFLYNVAALTALGAFSADYHTKEMWFTQP